MSCCEEVFFICRNSRTRVLYKSLLLGIVYIFIYIITLARWVRIFAIFYFLEIFYCQTYFPRGTKNKFFLFFCAFFSGRIIAESVFQVVMSKQTKHSVFEFKRICFQCNYWTVYHNQSYPHVLHIDPLFGSFMNGLFLIGFFLMSYIFHRTKLQL